MLSKRIAYNFMLHALVLVITAGAVYLLIGERSLQDSVLEEATPRRIEALVSSSHWQLSTWFFIALCSSFAASSTWIAFIAEPKTPGDAADAARQSGPWIAIFAGMLAVAALGYYFRYELVGARLGDRAFMLSSVLGFLAPGLAYWLGTALFVKPAMQPAVLGAHNLNIWSIGAR